MPRSYVPSHWYVLPQSSHTHLLTVAQMIKDARWTKLVFITYKDPTGKERTWESAERSVSASSIPSYEDPDKNTDPPQRFPIDGVGIVAILQKPSGPELVLQKQFRPPINKVVIEVPAGLVDAGEGAAASAVRELKEETGYVGVATEISPVMFNGV